MRDIPDRAGSREGWVGSNAWGPLGKDWRMLSLGGPVFPTQTHMLALQGFGQGAPAAPGAQQKGWVSQAGRCGRSTSPPWMEQGLSFHSHSVGFAGFPRGQHTYDTTSPRTPPHTQHTPALGGPGGPISHCPWHVNGQGDGQVA